MTLASNLPVAKVKSIECRFAHYVKSKRDDSDMHYIKEVWTLEDGTQHHRLVGKKDYERPFWMMPKGMRTYNDMKEWFKRDQLIEYSSTQTHLDRSILKQLELGYLKPRQLRDRKESIYVFGSDILSTALIKQEYNHKVKEPTMYKAAVFDTETDVVHGTEDILMATLSFKDKVFTAVQKSFLEGIKDPLPLLYQKCQEVLAEYITKRNIKLEIVLVDSEIDVVKATMAKAHEWGPDFLAAWNLPFDMNKVIRACRNAGIEPSEILCDPSIPEEYRSFRFKEGQAKKVTASGRVISYKPSQRWHTVFCPAKFYWVDAMSAYRSIRTGQPEESAYSLDYILNLHLELNKLSLPEAEHLRGLDWHRYMQTHQKLWYVAYNQFDCISMEMLDDKTMDLQLAMPSQAGYSDFQHFNSQPRRTVNELHFYCLENDHVIACTPGDMEDELDEETLSASGWIVMLPSERVQDNGLCIIQENPLQRTNIRVHNGDLDVSAAYPNNGISLNISKETCCKELIRIYGLSEHESRMQTLNYLSGRTNAIEFCTKVFKMPSLDRLLDAFEEDLAANRVELMAA